MVHKQVQGSQQDDSAREDPVSKEAKHTFFSRDETRLGESSSLLEFLHERKELGTILCSQKRKTMPQSINNGRTTNKHRVWCEKASRHHKKEQGTLGDS